MKCGCVVLASGEAARFNGNKLLASFMGEPLIKQVFNALPRERLQILVVTRSEEVAQLAQENGLNALCHKEPDISDTVRLGLTPFSDAQGCMFVVGDQPLLTKESINRLLDGFAENPTQIARLCFGARDGNPAVFPRQVYGQLLSLEKGQSGGVVMKRCQGRINRIPAQSPWELEDVDTREDLARLEEMGPNITK